jgi:hypothetical protein
VGQWVYGGGEALKYLDIPQGANGGDSGMVLEYLQAIENRGGIDAYYLLINCGLHDIKTNPETKEKQVSIENYRKNLQLMVESVLEMKPEMIWIRTTPCDEKVHNHEKSTFYRFAADCLEYNQAADKIMANAGVKSIDLHTFTANLSSDLYCYHVHFYEDIREKQAAFIAGWLVTGSKAL